MTTPAELAPPSEFTPQAVAAWLRLPTGGGVDSQVVIDAHAAVTAFVDELPHAPRLPPSSEGEPGPWAPQTILAAVMLAARLVRRRNSPAGVEAMAEQGAIYVSRYDGDVARMLRIDAWTPPQVG